jgi:predicted ATPase
VPLYAIETVRMLLDQGLLVQEGGVYRPTGLVGELEVPETLQGLLAARLDGLAGDERRVVQDASVLGKTFTREALMAISNLTAAELEPVLSSLVRKEVLGVQADPRSPERGQYGFLQDLVRRVAYETLARGDRKGRHLAAAAHLRESFGEAEQEIVEVVAAHYLAAYQAQPAAADAGQIKSDARELLARAGERAASLAAPLEAQRYFEQAAELADDGFPEAQLLERAGESARAAGRADAAQAHFERAIELFDAEGLSHPAARVSARLAWVDWRRGRLEQAVERMEASFKILSGDEADEDLALLAAELGRLHYFAGDHDLAAERIDVALGIAEAFLLQHVLTEALTTAALIASARGRNEQALGLVSHALKLALEHDQTEAAYRAYNNLATFLSDWDRYEESREHLDRGLALVRRLGDRAREWLLLDSFVDTLVLAGEWERALAAIEQIPEAQFAEQMIASPLSAGITIRCHRGQLLEARRQLELVARFQRSADVQERSWHAAGSATLLLAEGSYADALAAGRDALEAQETIGRGAMGVKLGFAAALEAALALGDIVSAEELLGDIERLGPGEVPPFLRALQARFRARLSAVRGERDGVEDGFKSAAAILREFGIRLWLAITLLEHGEWLSGQGRQGEAGPLFAEARELFERLEATPWLERVDRSAPVEAERQPA